MNKMSQLQRRIEELAQSVAKLDYIRDAELMEYLVGEVQHLINRIDSGRELEPYEHEELQSRKEFNRTFKRFYAHLLIQTPEPHSLHFR